MRFQRRFPAKRWPPRTNSTSPYMRSNQPTPGMHILYAAKKPAGLHRRTTRYTIPDPLPVALFDRQCWWRDRALESLQKSGRRYQLRFSSESVTGIAAAVSAGVAVGMLGEHFLRDDFRAALREVDGFPALPASNLVLQTRARDSTTPFPTAMCSALRAAFDQALIFTLTATTGYNLPALTASRSQICVLSSDIIRLNRVTGNAGTRFV